MKNPRIEAQARIATPLGPLTVAATAQGLAGAWFDGQSHHPGPIAAPLDERHPQIVRAGQALQAYFTGRPDTFALPLDAEGTAFQRAVWQALCEIAPGSTVSYGDIAQRIGKPAAVRAVVDGRLELHRAAPLEATLDTLRGLPGVGEWTAQVIAMRALAWPDAWPATDIGLMNALGSRDPKHLTRLAEAWRPWRAYAVMRLWHHLEHPSS